MRPPRRLVLRDQQAAERFGEVVAYVLQLLAVDAEGGAFAEVHYRCDGRTGRGRGGVGGEPVPELALDAGREVPEERKMRRDQVALGRVMGAAQLLEPAIVAVAEQSGDDDRPADAQIST